MEPREPPALYLEKLQAEDPDLAGIVCQKLSQQLVYVPVIAGGRSRNGNQITFQVVKLPEGCVPVFTTEEQYRKWAATVPEQTEIFTVMGGDLCSCVGERATVVLDLGAPHSRVLTQALMELVAASGKEPLVQDRSLRMDVAAPPAPNNSPSVQSSAPVTQRPLIAKSNDLPPSTSITHTVQSEEAAPPKAIESSATPPLSDTIAVEPPTPRGRAHPTAMMARPKRPRANIDESVHRQKAPLALDAPPAKDKRPVIRSGDPDSAKLIKTKDDAKRTQRRSLLKYLGG